MSIKFSSVVALLALVSSGVAHAALPYEKGQAVATFFSGPIKNSAGTIIVDTKRPVVGIFDVRDKSLAPLGSHWAAPAQAQNAYQPVYSGTGNVKVDHSPVRMGQVFGIAIDKDGNIFVTATTLYGQGSVSDGFVGIAGAGGVYKIDAITHEVHAFIGTDNAATYQNSGRIPNTGPGLGNVAYDPVNDQLFVTNFEDGEIYQITGLNANTGTIKNHSLLQGTADTTAGFVDSSLTSSNQFRAWAIAVSKGRVFYSLWREDQGRPSASRSNEIWSVGMNANGDLIPSDTKLEVTLPSYLTNSWSNPASDIEFSGDGTKMLVAERTMSGNVGKYALNPGSVSPYSWAHSSRVMEYQVSGWTGSIYPVGYISQTTNSAGGVDYAYAGVRNKVLTGCESTIWATADNMSFVSPPDTRLYGLFGISLATATTSAVTDNYLVDLDDNIDKLDIDKTQIGDVDVWREPCSGSKVQVTIKKTVVGAPEGFTGKFDFTVLCQTPTNTVLTQQVSITWPATTVTVPGVPEGSVCFVTESLNRPPAPDGYQWEGVPISNPPGGQVTLLPGKENTVLVRNVMRECETKGSILLTKIVKGVPSSFTSGTFKVDVHCWTGTAWVHQTVNLTYPNALTASIGNLPLGSSCTFSETGLPPLAGGYFWTAPVSSIQSGTFVIQRTCCQEVTITNEARYCCEGSTNPYGSGGGNPYRGTPMPAAKKAPTRTR